jgi:hypothetical protein
MERSRAVFLLSGWSGAGKDTVGKCMQHTYGAPHYAFADELKETVAKELDIPLHWTQTTPGKATRMPNGKTVRQILIQRGQEIRAEKNDPMYFAKGVARKILSKYESDPETYRVFCITDWRLPEEFSAIEQALVPCGFKVFKVRVKRVHPDGSLISHTSPVNDSLTETQLDRWVFDAYINNPLDGYTALTAEVEEKLGAHL